MIIKEVTFDCTIAMPGYNNVKPGTGTIVLEEGETMEEAWSELYRRAIQWHKKEFPHLYEPLPPIRDALLKNAVKYGVQESRGEDNDQLAEAIKKMQNIPYKEDAEAFLSTEKWMKYNKELKSLLNAKPNRP